MNLSIKQELETLYEKEVWADVTLGEALENWAKRFGENTAITFDGEDYSYEELNKKASKAGAGLLRLGFKAEDKIVVQLPNSFEFVALVFGMFKVGIVPIFEMGYKGKVIVSGENGDFLSTEALFEEEAEAFAENISPSSVALYLLSGGTTGIPKLIPRRHGDYLYMASRIAGRLELNEETVYLVSLPVEHNFPWGCPGVIGTLNVGGRVVLSYVSSPDEILGLIEDEGVTITALVPVLANMCIDLLEYDDYDLSTLKVVQVGGSVLEPNLAMRIEESFDCILQQVFGIAEGLICTTKLDDDDEIRFYKQGTPVSTYDEPRIVDENGKDVPVGQFGHLITRGPYTIYSYFKGAKECVDDECYFLTGDRARFCEDGNIQVVGRLMEMINRAGEKIDPTELEDMLVSHPDIEDVQVVGIKDENLGEKICVFIRDDEETLKLNEIREFLISNNVAAFKLPDQIKYVPEWPLTNVGKINRKELKKMGEVI